MIKVLHIFGKMNRGGAEMRTLDVMPLLAKKGVRFDFCTLSGDIGNGQLDDRIRQFGGEVYSCPLRPGILSFWHRFIKLLRQGNYDVVHTHVHYASGFIVWLASLAGVKGRILHFRSIADGKPHTLRRRLYRKTMRLLANRYATDILAVCCGAMEFGWNKEWQTDKRCQVIYNGLDTSVFEATPADKQSVRSEFGIPEKSKLFINVGRLSQPKAHDVLLKAAAGFLSRNSQADFLLAGDGELSEPLKALAQKLDISDKVHFLGIRYDIPRLLKASDCFVLSSRREGLPGVVLEAIAAGLPVIATALPGVKEIAQHTDLITIVPVEDIDSLTAALLKMAGELDFHSIGQHVFPEQFNLQHCGEKLYSIYSHYGK